MKLEGNVSTKKRNLFIKCKLRVLSRQNEMNHHLVRRYLYCFAVYNFKLYIMQLFQNFARKGTSSSLGLLVQLFLLHRAFAHIDDFKELFPL